MFSDYERYSLKRQGLGKLNPTYHPNHPSYNMKRKTNPYASNSIPTVKFARVSQNVRLPPDPTVIALNRQQAINRRLASQNRASMGFLGIEKKFYDTSLVTGTVAVTTDATSAEFDPSATSMISTPATGDGEQNRDGKQIVCDYLEIKGNVRQAGFEAGVNPSTPLSAFVAIVLDTQTNGAQMNSEDCFKNTSADRSTNVVPLRNLLFGKRFRILKSELFDITGTGMQNAANDYSMGAGEANFSWFIPLKGLKVNFNAGTTSSVANVIDNSIHVIAYANSNQAVTSLSYNARLRFMG